MKYFLLLLLLPLCTQAQRINLDSLPSATPINGMAYWYEPDENINLDLAQVLGNPGYYPFKKGSRYQEFFNTRNNPVYARFSLEGPPGTLAFLVVDNANVDSIDLWYQFEGVTRHLQAGSLLPTLPGVPTNTKFIFPLITDGNTQQILLRGRTSKRLIMPLVLVKPPHGYNYILRQIAPELIMLGMVLMLALYQSIRLLYSKSKQRFWYVLYLIALVCYAFLYLRGYGHFLGNAGQVLVTRFGVIFGALAYIFAMLFAWHYLDRSKAPQWYLRVFQLAFCIPLLTIVADLLGYVQFSYALLLGMGLAGPVFMLWFALLVYRKGDTATLYFIAGWTSVSLSVMINSLLVMKVIDPSFKQIPQILLAFTCLEMLLLSAGMGYRSSLVLKEKVALQAKLVNLLQHQKESLELQVSERTQDLEQALMRVEESDALKARLLAIISHDLRMPFVSLNAALDLLSLNILTPEKAQQKLANIKSNIQHIAGTLENLLTWSKHQQQRIETVPQPIHLLSLVRNVAGLLATNISSRKQEMAILIDESVMVEADPFQLETVLRNLLSNAIKASENNTAVGIRCTVLHSSRPQYRITVFDSGSGLQEPDLDAWLKNRSNLKDGSTLQSGLGLQICREFLANHDIILQYHHNGQGSEFSFVLPGALEIVHAGRLPQHLN
ncbi:Signal transduction histidine kinase [Cnuella takakiae]|uniref:histidine kinase n=1 Tax=Cnuella takakiae TaxID=1302690 RepID=A0A1M5GBP8_9BACT|nr:sensor histidine kinase [Cnuella takakiae]SHG01177.1 Signal transduction histidine kinase [Cnuella takakiae]